MPPACHLERVVGLVDNCFYRFLKVWQTTAYQQTNHAVLPHISEYECQALVTYKHEFLSTLYIDIVCKQINRQVTGK